MSYPEWRDLKTDRLLLRPLTLEDAPDVFALRSFEEVYKWSARPPFSDVNDATEWISERLERVKNFQYCAELLDPAGARVDASTPKVIATFGIAHDMQLGYQFHPAVWGRGLATEAIAAYLDELARHPTLVDMSELTAWVDSTNRGSQRVLDKLGFVRRSNYQPDRECEDVEAPILSSEDIDALKQSVEAMKLPMREDELGQRQSQRQNKLKLIVYELDRRKFES